MKKGAVFFPKLTLDSTGSTLYISTNIHCIFLHSSVGAPNMQIKKYIFSSIQKHLYLLDSNHIERNSDDSGFLIFM